jgi:ERCC4-type nuclease
MHFGSVGRIREAKLSELNKVQTIDEKMARRIIEYLGG